MDGLCEWGESPCPERQSISQHSRGTQKTHVVDYRRTISPWEPPSWPNAASVKFSGERNTDSRCDQFSPSVVHRRRKLPPKRLAPARPHLGPGPRFRYPSATVSVKPQKLPTLPRGPNKAGLRYVEPELDTVEPTPPTKAADTSQSECTELTDPLGDLWPHARELLEKNRPEEAIVELERVRPLITNRSSPIMLAVLGCDLSDAAIQAAQQLHSSDTERKNWLFKAKQESTAALLRLEDCSDHPATLTHSLLAQLIHSSSCIGSSKLEDLMKYASTLLVQDTYPADQAAGMARLAQALIQALDTQGRCAEAAEWQDTLQAALDRVTLASLSHQSH